MQLRAIFEKPVTRTIEGVIKADDEARLRVEMEEYVLTKEVEQRLGAFLDAYNSAKDVNGAWVSGFFGSGKSHLLKLLALLLENRLIEGTPAVDLFLPKCEGNEILRADIKRAVAIPSRSILFNIDQKADVISKTQIDALLSVFVKVFDELCGYYGKQGYIAQFERHLDNRGLYGQFQNTYNTIAGISWERGREQAILEADNIASAYADVTNTDAAQAHDILEKYRSQYRVSIEDFAENVREYIDRHSPDFRLNFFVDEVGQYVADNVKLMTNLQTIAESLATKCRGRSWIIVTSQEDLDSVLGQDGHHHGNDFSKIKARFACETGNSPGRLKLTSRNVDEVIQKRLLSKTDDGVIALTTLHHEQQNNFKTLFDFGDGSRQFSNFHHREHFVNCYPFIPYQFALFQLCIQNLSQHGAFEGKHSSVGERSMLGVFQQVAIHIGDHEIGQLATFDLMFEGIRTALKSNIQRAILQAENNLLDPLAIRLLKALFLVKYVKEFKSTVRNLCILVLDRFDRNLPQLRQEVETALELLEQQTYIQRNGVLYEYLTDEEKDVEQDIKNTEVETSEVAAELESIVFEHVIKTRKIRYSENSQDYPFSRKLDDNLCGREYELSINIISAFHEHAEREDILRANSLGRDELLVLMPVEARFTHDLIMYKRTEKYVRQNMTTTQQDTVRRILSDKSEQNRKRLADLQQRARTMLGKAKMFISGTEIEDASEDALVRVQHGFHELVTRSYPNLRMLRGITYSEQDIINILKQTGQNLFGNDATTMAESEKEILAFIQGNNRNGIRSTLKSLLEKFERKPNGWPYAAILCTLAALCARGKVEVRADSNVLESDELERALRNTHTQANLVLEPQVEFSASQIRVLKDFYNDFFDTPPHATDPRALGMETDTALLALQRELADLQALSPRYPFLQSLGTVLEKLREVTGKPAAWYLSDLAQDAATLLDMKETVIDPIRKFMNGPQRAIFDNMRDFIDTNRQNFNYFADENIDRLQVIHGEADCYKGSRMQQMKALLDAAQETVASRLAKEIATAKEAIASLQVRIRGTEEFQRLNEEQQQRIERRFVDHTSEIEKGKLIAVIRDTVRRFEEEEYTRLLSQMSGWAQPTAESKPQQGPTDASSAAPASATSVEQPIDYMSIRSIRVSFDKAWLTDENDVKRYLESMSEALLCEIRKGKRIQI